MPAQLELYRRLAERTRAQGERLNAGDLDGYLDLLDSREAIMREIDALSDGSLPQADLLEADQVFQEILKLDEEHRRTLEAMRTRSVSELGELAFARGGLSAYRQAGRGGPGEALFIDRKK